MIKSFSKDIQRNVQCIRCINRESDKCQNNDMYLIREECCSFVPRSYKSNFKWNEKGIEKLKNIVEEDE